MRAVLLPLAYCKRVDTRVYLLPCRSRKIFLRRRTFCHSLVKPSPWRPLWAPKPERRHTGIAVSSWFVPARVRLRSPHLRPRRHARREYRAIAQNRWNPRHTRATPLSRRPLRTSNPERHNRDTPGSSWFRLTRLCPASTVLPPRSTKRPLAQHIQERVLTTTHRTVRIHEGCRGDTRARPSPVRQAVGVLAGAAAGRQDRSAKKNQRLRAG